MAQSAMKYVVRTPEGTEYGPAEQDTLEQWAKAGRITKACEVRNVLMKKWHAAEDIPFLEGIVEDQEEEEAEDTRSKFAKLLNPTAQIQEQKTKTKNSLTQGGSFKFSPGGTGPRFAAFAFDVVLLSIVLLVVFCLLVPILKGIAGKDVAYFAITQISLIIVVMYFTFSMGFTAQTVGQYFWGLMVICPGGPPVLLARAFMFTVYLLIFFPTTLLFTYCLPSKRALQDKLSGVLVVNITSVD